MSGIAMGENYSHLTLEETCRRRGITEMGLSKVEIAQRLEKSEQVFEVVSLLAIGVIAEDSERA
ncbi:MAG: hypothetical protein ACE5EU_07000 [Paracoccaceae bacterium]